MRSMKDILGDTLYNDLYVVVPPSRAFDGKTYDPPKDYARMNGQLKAVHTLMLDHQWRTLSQIADIVHGSEAGISARLRDLRKSKYGSLTVERRRAGNGLWEYRLAAGN